MAISAQATDTKPTSKPTPKNKIEKAHIKKVPEICATAHYTVSGDCTTYSSSYTFCCFTCDAATALQIATNGAWNNAIMVAAAINQLEELSPC